MIDLSRTRAHLLAEIEAPRPAGSPLTDASDPRMLVTDAHLLVRGHTRNEIFPLLKVVLSERFADVPRPQLIQDLLVPLKNALGNAYKHGNERDRAKSISVEIVLTRKGGLIAITDEGPGFDVELTLRRMREGEHASAHRGAGFRNLDRAHSLVSYENGGRTVVLCFRPAIKETELASPPLLPSMPAVTVALENLTGGDPALRRVSDAEWMQSCLSAELPECSQNQARLEACRVYPTRGRASDHCGIRYVLQIGRPDARPVETRILTGRLHADEAAAEADFEAATKLYDVLWSKRLRTPRAVARLANEPRLVLYDFDPWMSLWEYLVDRGTPEVLRRSAERVGQALAELHQSQIPLPKAKPELVGERFRVTCARVTSNLVALHSEPDLVKRSHVIVQCIQERSAFLQQQVLAPIHGALGWDCIHYGVDGRFYLYRLEQCRLSDPRLDLGAFLADLLLFTASQGDEEAGRLGREAFLASYYSLVSHPTGQEILHAYVALTLLDRLDRLLCRLQPDPKVEAALLIAQCERILKGTALA